MSGHGSPLQTWDDVFIENSIGRKKMKKPVKKPVKKSVKKQVKEQVKFLITMAVVTFLCVMQLSTGLAKIPAHDSLAIQSDLSLVKDDRFGENFLETFLAKGEAIAFTETPTSELSLFAAGQRLFEQGKFAAAANIWQEVADQSEQANNQPQKALALHYVALADQQLEHWLEAKRAIDESLQILSRLDLISRTEKAMFAQVLNTAGLVELKLGHTQAALETWEKATIAYTEIGDTIGKLGSQINQAIALQTLGLYPRSQTIFKQVLSELESQPNSSLKINTLHQLGITLRFTGNLAESRRVLEQSLSLSQDLNDPKSTSAILLSLGNTWRDLGNHIFSSLYYQQSAKIAPSLTQALQANVNYLNQLITLEKWSDAKDIYLTIQLRLAELPLSNTSVSIRINLADILLNINSGKWQIEPLEIAQILTPAIAAARTLAAPKAESYALGTLGKLYEQNQQWQDAQKITQQALLIAQQIQAVDLIARWQWQQGRLFTNQGQNNQAILAYQEAVNSLQSLRADLVNIHRDVQFSFKETVEPVYRELVRLLVQDPTNKANLQQARQVIESLQVAELDNFFREACLEAKPIKIDRIDPTAAVIYPIILADRLAVILALPGADLTYYETKLPEPEIVARLEQFQIYLNPAFFDSDRLEVSQIIYDWLIRPAEPQLAASGIETLVFVLDSALRSLPIAALYDGQQYLIAKYCLALAPGLQLLNVDSVTGEKLSILMGGLSEGREMFSPLPGVETELTEISHILKSDLLLNQRFTNFNLAAKINSLNVPVVHIATHGQFSSQVEDTFILTWDGKMNVQEFNSILRSREQKFSRPLELLVLSACQTATGDRRAALGLAGFAVRSGARTTLGTLWQVSDRSTADLMIRFYQELAGQPATSKAKALQMAQLALLKNPQSQHPFYWAPFVLLGNWL